MIVDICRKNCIVKWKRETRIHLSLVIITLISHSVIIVKFNWFSQYTHIHPRNHRYKQPHSFIVRCDVKICLKIKFNLKDISSLQITQILTILNTRSTSILLPVKSKFQTSFFMRKKIHIINIESKIFRSKSSGKSHFACHLVSTEILTILNVGYVIFLKTNFFSLFSYTSVQTTFGKYWISRSRKVKIWNKNQYSEDISSVTVIRMEIIPDVLHFQEDKFSFFFYSLCKWETKFGFGSEVSLLDVSSMNTWSLVYRV